MADHNKPAITDTYANVLSYIDARLDDLAVGLDPARTSPTNLPSYSVRWSSASNKWEIWNGTAWGDISSAINLPAVTSPSFIPSGFSAPTNGMYLANTNQIGFATASTLRVRINAYGNVSIGTTDAAGAVTSFASAKPLTGGVTTRAISMAGTVQPDSTTSAQYIITATSTAANGGTPWTCGTISHFYATQGVFHADSTVTNQYGFFSASTLLGATTNYQYYAGNAAAVTTGKTVYGYYSNNNIATGGGTTWNFYASGTAPNYMAGDVRTNTVYSKATSPTNSNVTVTATTSSLISGMRTGTPAANIDLQVPTGTNMDAAFAQLQSNQTFEWSVINLAAATYAITVTANTDHTVVGNMVVSANTSGRFATRKTATNTFITYRIS